MVYYLIKGIISVFYIRRDKVSIDVGLKDITKDDIKVLLEEYYGEEFNPIRYILKETEGMVDPWKVLEAVNEWMEENI
jgi:hypothetical protein